MATNTLGSGLKSLTNMVLNNRPVDAPKSTTPKSPKVTTTAPAIPTSPTIRIDTSGVAAPGEEYITQDTTYQYDRILERIGVNDRWKRLGRSASNNLDIQARDLVDVSAESDNVQSNFDVIQQQFVIVSNFMIGVDGKITALENSIKKGLADIVGENLKSQSKIVSQVNTQLETFDDNMDALSKRIDDQGRQIDEMFAQSKKNDAIAEQLKKSQEEAPLSKEASPKSEPAKIVKKDEAGSGILSEVEDLFEDYLLYKGGKLILGVVTKNFPWIAGLGALYALYQGGAFDPLFNVWGDASRAGKPHSWWEKFTGSETRDNLAGMREAAANKNKPEKDEDVKLPLRYIAGDVIKVEASDRLVLKGRVIRIEADRIEWVVKQGSPGGATGKVADPKDGIVGGAAETATGNDQSVLGYLGSKISGYFGGQGTTSGTTPSLFGLGQRMGQLERFRNAAPLGAEGMYGKFGPGFQGFGNGLTGSGRGGGSGGGGGGGSDFSTQPQTVAPKTSALGSLFTPKQASSGSLSPNKNGMVDRNQLYRAYVDKFRASKLNGFVPSDGAKYGITKGTPEEWARFALATSIQESSLNAFAHGGGLNQFETADLRRYGVNGAVSDPDAQSQALVNQWSSAITRDGYIRGMRGPNEWGGATAYFGSIRRPEALRHMSEAQRVMDANPIERGDTKVDAKTPGLVSMSVIEGKKGAINRVLGRSERAANLIAKAETTRLRSHSSITAGAGNAVAGVSSGPFTKAPAIGQGQNRGDVFKQGSERLYYNHGNLKGVDPRLLTVLRASSKDLPPGYHAEIISGHDGRTTGTKNHPNGLAVDLQIFDDKGKMVRYNGNSPGWKYYEAMYRSVHIRGQEMYPGQEFIWGGAWISKAAGRGDPMHYQIRQPVPGSSQGSGQYSFEHGLNPNHPFAREGGQLTPQERQAYDASVQARVAEEMKAAQNPQTQIQPQSSVTGKQPNQKVILFAHGMMDRYGNTNPKDVEAAARKIAESQGARLEVLTDANGNPISGSGHSVGSPLYNAMVERLKKGDVHGVIGFSAGANAIAALPDDLKSQLQYVNAIGGNVSLSQNQFGGTVEQTKTIAGVNHMDLVQTVAGQIPSRPQNNANEIETGSITPSMSHQQFKTRVQTARSNPNSAMFGLGQNLTGVNFKAALTPETPVTTNRAGAGAILDRMSHKQFMGRVATARDHPYHDPNAQKAMNGAILSRALPHKDLKERVHTAREAVANRQTNTNGAILDRKPTGPQVKAADPNAQKNTNGAILDRKKPAAPAAKAETSSKPKDFTNQFGGSPSSSNDGDSIPPSESDDGSGSYGSCLI